jgi:hypothetical protein
MDLSAFSDSRGVSIFLAVVVLVIIGFLIADIVYFGRIKDGKTVTKEEASQMMWLNGLLMGLLFIIFLYYVWKAFASTTERHAIYATVGQKLTTAVSTVRSVAQKAGGVLAVSSITVKVNGQDVQAVRNPATGLYQTNVNGNVQTWDCNHSTCSPAGGGIVAATALGDGVTAPNVTDLSSLA